jgi:hypothetical protein
LRTKFGDGFVLGPKRPEEGEDEVSIYYVQISKRVEVHEMQVTEILKILEREEIYNETPYSSELRNVPIASDEQSMIHKFSNFMAGFCKPKPELKTTNQINDLAAERDKLLGQNTHAQKKEPITNDAQSRYSSNQPLIQERHPAIQAVQPQLQADVISTPNLQIIDNSSTNYSNSQKGKKKKKKRRVQKPELTQIEAVEDEEIEADHVMTKERQPDGRQKEPTILKNKAEAQKPYD